MNGNNPNDKMGLDGDNEMEDTAQNSMKPAVYPVDYPPNKRRLSTGKFMKYPAKEGETTEQWDRRRRREAVAQHRKKLKSEKEAHKTAGEVAIKTIEEKWTMEHDDPFILKVVGQKNFDIANPKKKCEACGNGVKMRLYIEQKMKKIHCTRKGQQEFVDLEDWTVGFHVDPDRNVGDQGTIKKNVKKLPIVEWLQVKKSTIEGAGLGLFASKDFKEGQLVGMCLGGKTGLPAYSIAPGWAKAENIHCYPFSHSDSMQERSTRTMGIQMINDPNHGLDDNAPPSPMWNVEFRSDLFVVALKNIKKGDEIFADYRIGWKDESVDDEEDDEDDGGGKMPAKKRDEDVSSD